ncbi:MAG: hypothetical protein JW904_14695 [Spirochaetales bacterium]|nr:hypothetical protein [Spirochaetales bacterium]
MKRIIVLCIVISGFFTTILYSQTVLLDHNCSTMSSWSRGAGAWGSTGWLLQQTSSSETMAALSNRVVQRGYLLYSFEITITGGLEDGYGGVGIHILSDTPASGRSWGMGSSVLLWLTHDVRAYGPNNFYGQIYHSRDAVNMEMIHAGSKYPLSFQQAAGDSPVSITGKKIKIRIAVDTKTGNSILYDPFQTGFVYQFNLGKTNLSGNFIAFRTNSCTVEIDNVRVVNLPE